MGRGEPIDRGAWPETGAHRKLLEFLDRVHADNGYKSRRAIADAMNLANASHVNDMLRGLRLPVDADQLKSLVRGLGGGDDDVRTALRLYTGVCKEPPRGRDTPEHPWVRLVNEHVAWSLVDENRDASAFRAQAAVIAKRLATLTGEAESALAGDPWLDTDLPERFTKRTGWLLRTTLCDVLRNLSPAEALLLAIVPLLHHTHMVRTLAAFQEVEPLDLGATDGGTRLRREYETFCQGHRELVERARAPRLPDRTGAGPEIGWWLFHRWIARFPETYRLSVIRQFLEEVQIADPRLRDEVLDPKGVQRFLASLRLDPAELADTDRQNAPQFEKPLFAGEAHEQHVREVLLAHILAVAYAVTIDLVRLPDIVVRHLGIPGPVDLSRLRDTVTSRAKWVLEADCLTLRADCHHPAELEGLRQYVQQVDSLLHTVRRVCGDHSTLKALTRLPVRASGDEVRPDTDEDGRLLFQRVSRFRLNERRVQDLLMGEQLYQDRGLAIRELYQNALDACRYRRACLAYRSQQGDWLDDWEGRIEFRQGVDANGRHFLECRDNGIGMTETLLTEVFSQAGTRFTDVTEFLVESAEWKRAEPPIAFHANSRFGIGVLSYFMIADEIEVVTRPLERGHRVHPTMKVSIFGPGHLFRIEHLPVDRSPGTTVKLYLRDGENAPSCVEELRRLLGVAEFKTIAQHDSQREVWEPGQLKPRERPSWESDGFNAHGKLVPWEDGEGGQVFWCEHGGGLLVDGLYVRPGVRTGVLAGLGDGTLRGAVVNLTGRHAPPVRLSVDRRQVLSDVSADVEALLRSALGQLMATGDLLNVRWIAGVTEASPRLADLITEAAIDAGVTFRMRSGSLSVSETGCFLQDSHLVLNSGFGEIVPEPSNLWTVNFGERISDHALIWRLMAHKADAELHELGIDAIVSVQPALPSDVLLLAMEKMTRENGEHIWPSDWWWHEDDLRRCPGHLLRVAMLTGDSPHDVAQRAIDLGFYEIDQECFAMDKVERIDIALLSQRGNGRPLWRDVRSPVPIGHLAAVAIQYGITLAEACARIERYGFRIVPEGARDVTPTERDLHLLRWFSRGGDWYTVESGVVPACQIVQVAVKADMTTGEVCNRLEEYGFEVVRLPLPERPSSDDLVLFDWNMTPRERSAFDPALPLPPVHLARAALRLGVPIVEVVARLKEYGVKVPMRLPQRVEESDLKLLSLEGDGFAPSWGANASIPLSHVLVMSRQARLAPQETLVRLADYGMDVPSVEAPLRIDDVLIRAASEDCDGAPPWLDPDEPVSRAHIVRSAAQLGMTPREVATLLATHGLDAPEDMPDLLDHRDVDLLRSFARSTPIGWLPSSEPVSLLHVLRAARWTGMSVREAIERLQWLGMDIRDLDEIVADALRRLPRA